MTMQPEDWMQHITEAFAPTPFERMMRESRTRQWARLEAEDPASYRRERRRMQIRMWCVNHHLPVPWWMRHPRLPADPRFENWDQRCVMTIPIVRGDK